MPPLSNRSSHPPMTGGGSGGNNSVSLSSSMSTYHASSLPPSKPPASSSSSSYQSGTKFHSSSSAVSSIEHVKGASSSLSSAQDQDTAATIEPSPTSSSSAPSFARHRIHRRTKDQDTKVATGNNHPLPAIKESLPASGGSGSNSNCGGGRSGVQFDLEAAAFPPLPGLDTDHGKASIDVGTGGSAGAVGMESSSQNRLSDVVKGTAKLKAVVKDKESGNQPQPQQQQSAASAPAAVNTASRSASPGASIGTEAHGSATTSANATHILNPPTANNENTSSADAAALSTVALTPPSSPDK